MQLNELGGLVLDGVRFTQSGGAARGIGTRSFSGTRGRASSLRADIKNNDGSESSTSGQSRDRSKKKNDGRVKKSKKKSKQKPETGRGSPQGGGGAPPPAEQTPPPPVVPAVREVKCIQACRDSSMPFPSVCGVKCLRVLAVAADEVRVAIGRGAGDWCEGDHVNKPCRSRQSCE